MIDLYNYFDEMQGMYNRFIKHSETLEDHHRRMRAASIALEQVRGWKKHITERPYGLRILNKLELNVGMLGVNVLIGAILGVNVLIGEMLGVNALISAI